jgi:hypothetical protein
MVYRLGWHVVCNCLLVLRRSLPTYARFGDLNAQSQWRACSHLYTIHNHSTNLSLLMMMFMLLPRELLLGVYVDLDITGCKR